MARGARCGGELSKLVDRWNAVAEGECAEPRGVAVEQRIGAADHERGCSQLRRRCEGHFEDVLMWTGPSFVAQKSQVEISDRGQGNRTHAPNCIAAEGTLSSAHPKPGPASAGPFLCECLTAARRSASVVHGPAFHWATAALASKGPGAASRLIVDCDTAYDRATWARITRRYRSNFRSVSLIRCRTNIC
jgi:hypothetical protein